LELSAPAAVSAARLHYRHVNQAEEYQVALMETAPGGWRQTIPAAYTESPFALLYFFDVRDSSGRAWLYPGLDADVSNQPYFVLRRVRNSA
jgi:hypothetical protein